MAVNLTTPVTGGAQTGFTAPTYTITADSNPDYNGKQWVVTGLGGTQTGVTVHTASSPFSVAFFKPKVVRVLGKPNLNGFLSEVPTNVYSFYVRKGATPAANQPTANAWIKQQHGIPAGTDTYDAPNIRAMISLMVGVNTQVSAGLGDTLVSSVM